MLPKVLVVDDDKRNVLLLESALKKHYDVAVAYTGEDALAKLETFAADVVLLDVMMPGMNGYDVCNAIREHENWKFMKVLLVSAKVLPSDRVQGYECGADDYITKPFNIDELRAKVKVFLRLKNREELDELKSNLIMLIAHELRTPLTGIVGATEILKELHGADNGVNEALDILDGNTSRLKTFVEKIIKLSNIKKGIDLHRKEIDFLAVLFEAKMAGCDEKYLKMLDQLLQRADEFESLKLYVDPYFFAIALASLFQHIVDQAKQIPDLEIGLMHKRDQLQFHFYDCASCVSEEDCIDDEFAALSVKDIYHYHEGNGLDMAIVYGIVRAHGGVVELDVNSNGNQVFIITLPSLCTV